MKKLGIIGCGWLGLYLAKHFSTHYKIYTTARSEKKKSELIALGYESEIMEFRDDCISPEYTSWDFLEKLDSIIITVPFSKRTDSHLLQNRFSNICSFLQGYSMPLYLMSSIGIYPQIETEISENSLEAKNLHQGILSVEQLMKHRFPQLNILRLGGLMGGERIFSKYPLSSPTQIVNHVHYDDICRVVDTMMTLNIKGKAYNVVAPQHPMKQEIINYQLGTNDRIVNIKPHGRKVVSHSLINELNYEFRHPDPVTFK